MHFATKGRTLNRSRRDLGVAVRVLIVRKQPAVSAVLGDEPIDPPYQSMDRKDRGEAGVFDGNLTLYVYHVVLSILVQKIMREEMIS